MAYLTRMELNSARRGFRRLAGNPGNMHGAVEASTPRTDGSQRKLWRLDTTPEGTYLYLVTATVPDLQHIAEQAGWPTRQTWQTRSYQPFLETLRPSDVWAFRLRGNPVRSGRSREGKQTQRYGHVTVEQQAQWLRDRAARWGFSICSTNAGDEDLVVRERAVTRFRREGAVVSMSTAVFEGRLRVDDAHRLRSVLLAGAGHGKAHGCGLLTLAR